MDTKITPSCQKRVAGVGQCSSGSNLVEGQEPGEPDPEPGELGRVCEDGETEVTMSRNAQETEPLLQIEQRFIKLVVPFSQIMVTFRVIGYPSLQRISFLESGDTSDSRHKN